jgi:purine catabolism regulator
MKQNINVKSKINAEKAINEVSLTVEDVLKLKAFKRHKVIAGVNGLKNKCYHMVTLETPEGINWGGGGEFLLTAGFAFLNNEQYKKTMIRDAYNRGFSAIGIKENRYFGDISEKIIKEADEFNIPLVIIPCDLKYTDAISGFYDFLFYKKNEYILNQNTLYKKLLNLSFKDKDLDEVLNTISMISNSNAFLFDEDFRLKGQSVIDTESYKCVLEYFPFNPDGKEIIGGGDEKKININLGGAFASRYPIIRNNKTVAHVYIIKKYEIGTLEQKPIEYGVSIISLKLERKWMVDVSQSRFNKTLVEMMLNNKDLPSEFYTNVERNLGWSADGVFVCFCIRVSQNQDEDYLNTHKYVFNVLDESFGINNYLTTERSDEVFVFLKIQSNAYFHDIVTELGKGIGTLRERLSISVGVSGRYNSLKDIERLYDEAYLAALFSEDDIIHYTSLNTMKLLYPLKDDDEIANYYSRTIEKLEKYDYSHNANLLETLEVYFRYNMNKKLVAEKLFIHVETLRYRLARIEEITGFSVNDAEGSFSLQMGLKLKRILRVR